MSSPVQKSFDKDPNNVMSLICVPCIVKCHHDYVTRAKTAHQSESLRSGEYLGISEMAGYVMLVLDGERGIPCFFESIRYGNSMAYISFERLGGHTVPACYRQADTTNITNNVRR